MMEHPAMKHLVHASSLAALGLLSLLTAARAQSTSEEEELAQAFGDKTTVSIATGATQLLRRAPAVASVVTAADMAAAGVTDLDQALATVPGLHVSRNLQAYNPLYVIRGIYSEYNNQTLVLYKRRADDNHVHWKSGCNVGWLCRCTTCRGWRSSGVRGPRCTEPTPTRA